MKTLLIALSFLFTVTFAMADVKITQLPLGSAATSGLQSVFPYVDTTTNTTNKLKLSDLPNVPALAAPSFCTAKAITGFVSGAGTVSASDTILTALNKINGNVAAISAASTSVGALDGQSANANGQTIASNVLYGQSASGSFPGMVNTTTQTFAGQKTFSTGITGTLTGTASGNEVPLSFTSPILRTVNTISCQVATGSVPGCLAAADFTTFNGKQAAGNYITALTGDAAASGPGSAALTLATVNSNVGSFTNASVTVNAKGLVTAASSATTTGSGSTVLATSPTIVTPTIAKLANLTSNGIVTTSGGDGTLSVTATTGSGNVVLATSPTIVTPTIAKISNLTTNGYVKTSGSDGTLGVQTVGIPVADGGTGATTLTNHGVLLGQGTSAVVATTAGAGGTILQGAAGADPTFTATPTLGIATSVKGTLAFAGNTSGTVTIQPAAAAGTWSLTLPTTAGTANYFLQTDGSGVTTWAAGGGSSSFVGARIYGNTTSTLTGNTYTDMVYTTEDYDVGSNMASSQFTCPQTGYYNVSASIYLRGTLTLTDFMDIRIMVDGSEKSSSRYTADVAASTDMVLNVSDILACTATKVIKIQVRVQGTSGQTVLTSNFLNFFTVSLAGT